MELYEPAARLDHISFLVEEKVYLWGGKILRLAAGDQDQLARCIEQFDPYLEIWSQLNTAGTPHPGLEHTACASHGELVFMYGGQGTEVEGALSCLNFAIKTPTWLQLCPAETVGGPMRKTSCGMVHFHDSKLAVIGGYGYLNGPIQPGSEFFRKSKATSGIGWTNEIHIFDVNRGVWFSPVVRGTRPPPCSSFTLTSVDNHRAVLFGGLHPDRVRISDLYLVDFDTFDTMTITKVEPCEGEPWPAGRSDHAACCLGYAGDHIHLLVTGGLGRENKLLNDTWLFNLLSKKWKEVSMPDDNIILPTWSHSTTAHILCPGLIDVIKFGGCPDDLCRERPIRDHTRIAETIVITFSQVGSEWDVVGVANNSQQGTSVRVREKMLKMSEVARAAIDNGAERQPDRETSQADKRALEGRVEEAEAAVREERTRARDAENRAELAERTVMEERQRAQEAERRTTAAIERATEAEERERNLEGALIQERLQAQESQRRYEQQSREERRRADQRIRNVRQELAALQERERAAEIRVQEAQQQAQQRVEEVEQTTEEQLHRLEERAQAAERRSRDLRRRARDAEQRAVQRTLEAEQRANTRVQEAELHTTAVERHLHEVEQRARESERRARQAEALVQQSQQESHWLVQRREIELTEEEKGRGGWAAVKVANFCGTRVAAKCFYQQILVSPYNRQLFNREMNMAARLRHPNLIQFIGASLEGEPIIITELMTTSLRAELEKGPIEHAQITSISLDVARALNYLHLMQPHPIIHRDISSANVLLDPLPGNSWKAKVSDYGSVNLLRELRTVGPGNPVYAAPEASVPAEQSPKMDIFSFGVLLIEMLSDEFPAEDARQRLLDSINHAGYLDLIGRCLREQKEERPSANEIIAEISEM